MYMEYFLKYNFSLMLCSVYCHGSIGLPAPLFLLTIRVSQLLPVLEYRTVTWCSYTHGFVFFNELVTNMHRGRRIPVAWSSFRPWCDELRRLKLLELKQTFPKRIDITFFYVCFMSVVRQVACPLLSRLLTEYALKGYCMFLFLKK